MIWDAFETVLAPIGKQKTWITCSAKRQQMHLTTIYVVFANLIGGLLGTTPGLKLDLLDSYYDYYDRPLTRQEYVCTNAAH